MKTCPYCKKEMENHWSYCPYCNKPLIVGLHQKSKIVNHQTLDEDKEYYSESNPFTTLQSEKFYDPIINNNNEIEERIREIDQTIQQKITFGETIGSLILEKSSLYYKNGDLSTSIKILELALKNFTDEGDFLHMAISHNELGLIYEDTGFFNDAIYQFEQAIDILEKLTDYKKLIQVYNNIANIYYIFKDIEISYRFYNMALKLAEQESLIGEAVKTSSNIVEVLFLLKDYDKINRILKRNLEYFRNVGDIFGIIVSLSKIGKLNYHLGSNYYKQAHQSLNDALDLIKKIDYKKTKLTKSNLIWECYLYLGKLNLQLNKYGIAEDYLLKSLEAIRSLEDKGVKESLVLETMAEMYEIKGEYQEAINYYNLSNEIYNKFGENIKIADLKFKIALIYMDFIKIESEAIKNFEESLEIFNNLNYSKESAEILHQLGDLYLNRGIIELAIDHFERAKRIYFLMKDDYNLELIDGKIKSLIN